LVLLVNGESGWYHISVAEAAPIRHQRGRGTMSRRTQVEIQLFNVARAKLPESISHAKCWRLVDFFVSDRAASGCDYRRISYVDPTGETATFRAFITSLRGKTQPR
jgi:hypothetical protein